MFNFGNLNKDMSRNDNQETGGGGGGNPSSGGQTGNAPPHAFGPSAAAALAKDPVAAAALAPNLVSTAAPQRSGDEEEQRRQISGLDFLRAPTSSVTTPTSKEDGKMAKPVPVNERIALSWSGLNVKTIPKGKRERK